VAVRASRFLSQASRADLLREVFTAGEVDVISEVARLLAEVEPDEALGLLSELLGSADFEVRLAAVAGAHAAVARWPDQRGAFAAALSVSATGDSEALVREAAVALAEELGHAK
jgi:HEAT repeat protein